MSKLHRLAKTAPMEAKLVSELPSDGDWQFEPKWDGFRAIASRDGDAVELMSKSGKSLARFFPEIAALLANTKAKDFVIDGELILPVGDVLSFEALQARLHPADSRIRKLAKETPAQLMLFDCLALGGKDLISAPLAQRRGSIEAFVEAEGNPGLPLSPATRDAKLAKSWLAGSGGALDGVIAKLLGEPYRGGERAMLKVKQRRSADCVVGGFRRAKTGPEVASLLLGLYDAEDKLNYVGFTSAFAGKDKAALTDKLEKLIAEPGFTGNAPGGPSRWNKGEQSIWYPLRSELIVAVSFDQVTGGRFRHGTKLLRWRSDKAPHQCRMEQLDYPLRPSELLEIR
ncbi:ATP-dependent DNA ligase [Novosphingobium sp. G106]|uniref:ATP-dependent DNA ligase n=1 Tax=Novosphingobium sp. G106 TaxID=2849500 RepID=UPI001C2CE924|nr:ATP-dependent DNA ligase [Novosphingobium sp. G106]MBV1690344.1 ATP-dependent DNA ligase [Novosphingobium sp. G106]